MDKYHIVKLNILFWVKITVFSLALIFNNSCSILVDNDGTVVQEFHILNTKRKPKTVFTPGDTIVFLYRLHNTTGKDLTISMVHGGPLVRFHILLDTVIVRDSFEGYAFPSNAPSYSFQNNKIIEEEWVFNCNRLAKDTYTAKAVPEMFIENEGVPPARILKFAITY